MILLISRQLEKEGVIRDKKWFKKLIEPMNDILYPQINENR